MVYRALSVEAYTQALVGAGVSEEVATQIADSERGAAEGKLFTDSGDLHRLIGRPTTPPTDDLAKSQDVSASLRQIKYYATTMWFTMRKRLTTAYSPKGS